MLFEENKPLAPYTTFGIGGPARWFLKVTSEDEIVEATGWARDRGVPLFVLGGGSNLLVADRGFDGLVLKVGLKGIEIEQETSGLRNYKVAAGEDWDRFVQRTVDEGCAGVECLAGIPGTVGGTPVQNVGAYGQEVSSVIALVRAFRLEEPEFVEISNAECGFAYRRSRFNSLDRGQFIVTRVDYMLKPGDVSTVIYPDLQRALDDGMEGLLPMPTEVARVIRQIRRSKGMLLVEGDPDCRSAGSFFKNPVVGIETVSHVAGQAGEQPPVYPVGSETGQVKLPAAWLIERAGFSKGYALNNAGISSRHTLALINRGDARAADVLALANRIMAAVQARFGIELELEPVLLGF